MRDHVRSGALPCFKVKGKILIKQSEFDIWLEQFRVNKKKDIEQIVDGALESLKTG